jgi:hypothetical protein
MGVGTRFIVTTTASERKYTQLGTASLNVMI